MKAYELLFFLNPALEEEMRLATLKRVEEAIKNIEGTIDGVDEWGRRKLAYEIDGLVEGDYTLINFQANPDTIKELKRVLGLIDAIKRFMIVRHAQDTKED